MDDTLRERLRELIAREGRELPRDGPRCEALVRQACAGKMPETSILVQSLAQGVPLRLLEAPGSTAGPALVDQLSQGLQDNLALSEAAARWAVTSWAAALGLADQAPAAGAASTPAFDIDPPACFYLGREYDLATKAAQPDKYVMYDARDLTTHGVIVGMTGSGKTGLAITVLEEAAIDGYPCVIIDPKGDLTNLLLQFPDLDPTKIEPWLNVEEARARGLTPRRHAEELAARWRKGLEETGQTIDRIGRLRASADWRIYTPGSEAGLPLSILRTFAAPGKDMPREALTHKIDATTTALLGLSGITADPVQSREHILVARLLLDAWEHGRDLDLAGLILQIQSPPFRTVGTYNLETFFPARDRIKFASTLNNVLASPGFATWMAGEPMDLASMLYRAGKPQQLIFHIAHLDDRQRMFFTTLLLEEVLGWVRRQPGSSNLRAVVYFDEVFGYLPPHPANPPSKGPLLTLLKQARAFGVGILLATQNPVDLDYKALSNAGTWFVGKLQTERDKLRLLDGLESVAAEQGTLTDRSYLETVISSLGNRVFLMHDVHRPGPVLFQSRWALSLLRGPMTRDEVGRLMEPYKRPSGPAGVMAIPLCTHCHAELGPEVTDTCPCCGKRPWANAQFRRQEQAFRERLQAAPAGPPPAAGTSAMPPVLPPEVTQFYLPARGPARGTQEYQPRVLGAAEVAFVVDRRKGAEHVQTFRLLAEPPEPGHPVGWDDAAPVGDDLASGPAPGARWAGVPVALDTGRKVKALEKAFADYLYGSRKLQVYENRALGLVSAPGETLAGFQDRCRAVALAQAQQALHMEKVKFGPKFEALGMRLPEDAPKKQGGFWSWLTPSPSSAPSGPPSSRVEEKQRKLAGEYQAKKNEVLEKWKRAGEEAAPVEVKPRKSDVRVSLFGLAWVPFWRTPTGTLVPGHV
jgi:hypothetical protein